MVNLGGNTLGVGTYLIMNYGGSASGTVHSLIVSWRGHRRTSRAIDASEPGSVKLVVLACSQPQITSVSLSGTNRMILSAPTVT